MERSKIAYLSGLISMFVLSGCVVRSYPVTKNRIDQDVASGNRGYLTGQLPQGQSAEEKKDTRTVQIVEVELHSPIKFEKAPPREVIEREQGQKTEDQELWGNRGYITKSSAPQIQEPQAEELSAQVDMEKYTVQKNDTLQKISQRFYGTTKKWIKIYNANKGTLKGPNKIYPGQVINIPSEGLKGSTKNLK